MIDGDMPIDQVVVRSVQEDFLLGRRERGKSAPQETDDGGILEPMLHDEVGRREALSVLQNQPVAWTPTQVVREIGDPSLAVDWRRSLPCQGLDDVVVV
jgi:hypothetical protein